MDSETAAKHLDRTLGFFSRVEAKASFLFALNTAMLGIEAMNVKKLDFEVWYHLLALVAGAGLNLLSLFFVYRCIFPALKGGHASLLYFREIAKLREAEYLSLVKARNSDEFLDDYLAQIWRNSEILNVKFDAIKIAFQLTAIATLPWTAFLAIAALSHPDLPVFK